MKKILLLLIFTTVLFSCSDDNIKWQDVSRLRLGMHINEVANILQTEMKSNEFKPSEFLVGKGYTTQDGYHEWIWMVFNNNDSTLIDFY